MITRATRRRWIALAVLGCCACLGLKAASIARAQEASPAAPSTPSSEPVDNGSSPTSAQAPASVTPAATTTGSQTNPPPADANQDEKDKQQDKLVRLDPQAEVWIDAGRRRVIVGGQICLREGLLEMFACPKGTKEHESIVSVNAKAYVVHAALLAIGAKPGQPVQYDPVYKPASGERIAVEVIWRDEQQKVVRRRAQEMVRNVKTRAPMDHDWVFAGSGFWQDESTGKQYYQAEGGELICLSNFSTATLDLTVESSRDNAALLFEAFTDNIPPLGTPVRLVLSIVETQ